MVVVFIVRNIIQVLILVSIVISTAGCAAERIEKEQLSIIVPDVFSTLDCENVKQLV